MTTSPAWTAELTDLLRRSRNADGGWGYYPQKASRLEPTCWALLALGREADDAVLRGWPEADGLLLERSGGASNYAFHGLALLTLLHRGAQHRKGIAALVSGVGRIKGVALPDHGINRQDNAIQAWSWTEGTFSWVEPTAYCLLALKKAARSGIAVPMKRIADAEAMLLDRCCATGGWNYGNSNMLGQELAPYVPTTALALLALQDRRSEGAFTLSRDYLERSALSEPSAVALSLAAIALRGLGRPVRQIQAALAEQTPTTIELGNLQGAALALFALGGDHGDAPFIF